MGEMEKNEGDMGKEIKEEEGEEERFIKKMRVEYGEEVAVTWEEKCCLILGLLVDHCARCGVEWGTLAGMNTEVKVKS